MAATTRRTLLAGGAALAAGLARPSILRAAPAGEVTVAGFFGSFQDNYTSAVIEPFMRANPDIKVTFRPVRGSAEATAMLRTSRGSPGFDLAILDLGVAQQNARDGLLAPLDRALIPNAADLPVWGQPKGNMGAALTQDMLVMLYTPAKVQTPPRAWMDLADSAYAGRLGLPVGDIRGTVLLALLARAAGADYRQNIDPAIAALKRIAANAQTFDPQPDIYTAIRSGLIDIGIGWNARGQFNANDSKGAFAVAVPTTGTAPQVNTINLVAKPANPVAAQTFINHALSAPAQQAFAAALYYGPTNTKAMLDPTLSARIFGGADIRSKQMDLDWDWFSRNNNALIQRIRREVMAG
jgi:putative spermidine/putrescine transport system substrate-binding protein